jgi:hypothetical protein
MLRSRTRSPSPHGRFELKYKLRPSFDRDGAVSLWMLLMGGPRFCGSDQPE